MTPARYFCGSEDVIQNGRRDLAKCDGTSSVNKEVYSTYIMSWEADTIIHTNIW